jgi:hypothetical protein
MNRGDTQMFNATNETLRNTKTGNVGYVICKYLSTKTSKPMVQVWVPGQMKPATWLWSNTEAA